MNSGSKVFSNSFFYSFGAVLGKCLGLILLSVYTFYLSQKDYGIINLLPSFSSMLSYLVLLALDSALMRFYVDYKDSPETLRRLYGSLITVVVSCYAVTAAVIFLFRRSLEKTFFAGISFFPYILISVLILGEGSTFALHRRYLETVQQGKKLTFVLLAEVFLTAGVAVSLLALFRLGAVGMLLATLSSSTFLIGFMIVDILLQK